MVATLVIGDREEEEFRILMIRVDRLELLNGLMYVRRQPIENWI